MDCKIIYTGDKRTGVYGLDGNPSETFQEILNNPLNKNFDSALEIFLETYSGEFEMEKSNIRLAKTKDEPKRFRQQFDYQ